jgi:hypothetical protein
MTAIFSDQIRSYIQITESLEYTEAAPEPVVEPRDDEPMDSDKTERLKQELRDLVSRLRAHMESEEGDFSLGVEYGMQMAADMIENMIARNEEPSEPEIF